MKRNSYYHENNFQEVIGCSIKMYPKYQFSRLRCIYQAVFIGRYNSKFT